MKNFTRWMTQLLHSKTIVAILMVSIGVGLTLVFGLRSLHSFRRMPPLSPLPHLPPHAPDAPTPDIEGIREWMNLKFVTKVYQVPPTYLHTYLGLSQEQVSERLSLGELNQKLGWGNAANGKPLIVERVKQAIEEFKMNEGTKLRDIQPEMSMQFIAVVTEIPLDYLFEHLGIPKAGNEYKSIDLISQEQNYAGGWEALGEDIQAIINAYQDQ